MERTKQTIKINPQEVIQQITLFVNKWGYKTLYINEENILHLKRINPKSKTFYYREAIIEKINQKFDKIPFKIQ